MVTSFVFFPRFRGITRTHAPSLFIIIYILFYILLLPSPASVHVDKFRCTRILFELTNHFYFSLYRHLRDGTLREHGVCDGSRLTLLPSVETGLLVSLHRGWLIVFVIHTHMLK